MWVRKKEARENIVGEGEEEKENLVGEWKGGARKYCRRGERRREKAQCGQGERRSEKNCG